MSADLRFERVTRRFGQIDALMNLSLLCSPAAMTCLVGPNGGGKSTALALAAGLLSPSAGQIIVNGIDVDLKTPLQSTGYLPQRSSFHNLLLVGEVIDFTCALRGANAQARQELLAVTGLLEVVERPVGSLSGGWLRRLGIFSCLLGSPRLLLLDEPFVGLDPETHDRLVSHLEDRLAAGATIVVSSHDFEVIDRFKPLIVVLVDGHLQRIESAGGPTTSHDSKQSSRSLYLETLTAKTSSQSGDRH